ncbi:hypothetical protein [Halococcus saccharolyticus]|uniref:Uncharacterized protein n=1 Tax=Halococcus saccharolyticus DSM 5350 TaxID=1227455 RepID=M0MEU4_9EURY|nr:hypothetical protein [Halococcus saccharolyticus]EMA44272.1 hypothetical protein C449_12118 [Halococcus saccharolyticus DSM 5350]
MSHPDHLADEREAEQAGDRCRHGAPGCAGPAGFDREFHNRPVRVCNRCVREATGRPTCDDQERE